jgi:type I restriction enzyme R subunit
LESENEQFEFVKSFRELLRLKNILESFSEFKFESLNINKQEFEDYKSKYLDIYDKVKKDHSKEKVSILENVDFELELIQRDDITIDYILSLLAKLGKKEDSSEYEKRKKAILDMVS